MAENKKSFILYTDSKPLVDKLPDDVAGRLFKYLFSYVSDENPQTEEILLEISFEHFKTYLKRDLKKWDKYIDKQRLNGSKGGRPKTQITQPFISKPKKADSVSVNVSVNVKDINTRLAEFKNSLHKFKDNYNSNTLTDFYLYWTEKKPKGRKMLFEMQKTFDISRRLARWDKNNFNKTPKKEKKDAAQIIHERHGIQ